LGISAATTAMPGCVRGRRGKRPTGLPNVVVIITDDQGWSDIGYNNPKAYTPNLDRLAREGATFLNHYAMPQCTPTRVAALTGRYPGRFGPNALMASNDPPLPVGTPTLATMFKSRGYDTFLCGKWHLGSKPEHGPNLFGFDESYGSLAGAVGMYDHRYRKGEYEHTWHRDHALIEGAENGTHATDLVARAAVEHIEQPRANPFFLYLAFHAPHTPLDERGRFRETPTQLDPANPERWLHEDGIPWFNDPEGKIQREPDPEKRLLLAAVHHVDHAIGQAVAALDRTGKRENTLILFSSDNGPQVNWSGKAYPDDLRLTDFNQPIPMRGHKTHVWEGGIHVPGFANWPGHIPPKQIKDPVHIIDWFPTLAEVIDFVPDTPIPLDGTSLASLLFGRGTLKPRELYWVWHKNTNRWALRHGDWKVVKYGQGEPSGTDEWQLFNLKKDPRETQNIAEKHPLIVSDLHQRFLRQRAKDKK